MEEVQQRLLSAKNGGYSSKVRAQKGGGHRKARETLSAYVVHAGK